MASRIDVSKVVEGLADIGSKFDAALQLLAESGAEKMESYAKHNRPWKDRTGRARQSLKGLAYKIANGYRIEIAHGVEYGIYLEYAHERKYAILEQTVNKVGVQQILPAFHNFLEKAGR